jgi:O-antigen/teichoic acid export membrane protein
VGEAIVLIVVFLVVSNQADLWRVPVSQLIGDTAAALLLLVVLQQYGVHASLRWDSGTVRPLVRHVAPYVGSALLGLAIFNSDLLFLRAFADRATVGLYAAAYALVSFLINVGATYALSLIPPLAQLAGSPVARQSMYGTAWARALAVVVPLAVGGGLIAHEAITLFFGPDFAAAGTVLVVLLISVPLSVLRSIAASALMAQGREDILFRTVLIAATVNIALMPSPHEPAGTRPGGRCAPAGAA